MKLRAKSIINAKLELMTGTMTGTFFVTQKLDGSVHAFRKAETVDKYMKKHTISRMSVARIEL